MKSTGAQSSNELQRLDCTTLQWRHNGHNGFSNQQPHDCLLNLLFRCRSKEHQSSASLAFVQGINWWPVNSLHKRPVTQKIFPFDGIIMIGYKYSSVSNGHQGRSPTLQAHYNSVSFLTCTHNRHPIACLWKCIMYSFPGSILMGPRLDPCCMPYSVYCYWE